MVASFGPYTSFNATQPLTEHKISANDHYLHVIIAVSGWVYETSEFTEPWKYVVSLLVVVF